MQPTAASKGSHSRGDSRRGRLSLRRCHRGFAEGAVVAKTPPNSGKRTIIGGRKAQIGPFSGMRDAARKTLRQNPRSENCATEARLPRRIADHRLSSICPNSPPLFQQGGPPMQEKKQFVPIWIKDVRRGGAPMQGEQSARERKREKGTQLAAAKRQSPNIRGNGPQKRKLHRLRTARS